MLRMGSWGNLKAEMHTNKHNLNPQLHQHKLKKMCPELKKSNY